MLDLFSAAAGGWSLGMHRAGFETVAACENVAWRRALYSENNPGVRLYDDVCTLTADRLIRDLGYFPAVLVGSPPCQDISSANSKGKGVDGAKSGLFFEAVRLIREGRPRWFALENSPLVRVRGYDRLAEPLEADGYACWPLVVGADDVGANHERKRAWIIGFDPGQNGDAQGDGRGPGWPGGCADADARLSEPPCGDDDFDAAGQRCEGRRSWRHGPDGHGRFSVAQGKKSGNADSVASVASVALGQGLGRDHECAGPAAERADRGGAPGDGAGQRAGVDAGSDGLGGHDREPWPDWNGGLARHLRDDDGLSLALAQRRFLVSAGSGKTVSGSSLLVEALGDAVLPQIPEAIGRAILRTEAALAAVYGGAA